jgi:hypothetical protein
MEEIEMSKFMMYSECSKCKKKFPTFYHYGTWYSLVDICPKCGDIKQNFRMVSAKKLTHWYSPWTWFKKEKWEVTGKYYYKY